MGRKPPLSAHREGDVEAGWFCVVLALGVALLDPWFFYTLPRTARGRASSARGVDALVGGVRVRYASPRSLQVRLHRDAYLSVHGRGYSRPTGGVPS